MTRIGEKAPLTHRQLAFARFMAEGKPWRDAQAMAGFKPNRKHKNLMLDDPRIAAEIARLRGLFDVEWARRQADDSEAR